jgi:hypothetical protein
MDLEDPVSQASPSPAIDEDLDMEVQDHVNIQELNQRRHRNLCALNAIILSDPTLANMLLHGQGLQQMANSLAGMGQRWFDEVVLPNNGHEPRIGSMEVDTFHQHLALKYPNPHRIIHNPNMDQLAQLILDTEAV